MSRADQILRSKIDYYVRITIRDCVALYANDALQRGRTSGEGPSGTRVRPSTAVARDLQVKR